MYNCDESQIIKFDADFDEDFDNVLLEILGNVKRIYFLNTKGFGIKAKPQDSKFNKSVDLLPNEITHIKFGSSFNCSVNNLPNHLIWLEFGKSFNQPVDSLPHTITYLVLGDDFNHSVDDLPNLLEYISFGKNFNQSIDCLPNSIQFINIGNIYSMFGKITNHLPSSLNNLVIHHCKKYPIKFNFVEQLNNKIKNNFIE